MAVVHADCTTYIVDWLRDARDLSEMNLALRRELQAMQVTNMSHCHLINLSVVWCRFALFSQQGIQY